MKKDSRRVKPVSRNRSEFLDSLRRKRETRDPAKKFLIVCEDSKSSKFYFEALKKHFGFVATKVVVQGSIDGRTQPNQIVDRAIKLKSDVEDSGGDCYDEVWCVIDGDSGKDKIRPARAKAKSNNIQLAISTPCFEYWLLLHFEASAIYAEICEKQKSMLKKYLPDYDKGSRDFSMILPKVQDASLRAEKYRKIRLADKPEDHNPCSEIYLLTNSLFDFFKNFK